MTARNFGFSTLVVVLAAGFTACFTAGTRPDAEPPEAVAQPDVLAMSRAQIAHAGIRWTSVTASMAIDTLEVPGQLGPNEDRTARLGSPARARVLAVHVHMGDRVARNQPLVALASEQAATARAEYTKAVAELSAHRVAARYARTALARAERLLALKAISRQDVEKARVDQEEAESTHAQAEAELERARITLEQLGVSRT